MFWGLILHENKRYSQKVSKAFHLSQAALDINNCTSNNVQVQLTSEKQTFILCTLNKDKNVQFPLDLMFAEGDEVAFSCIGGTVHLSGYLILEDPADMYGDLEGLGEDGESEDVSDDDEDDDDDDEEEETVTSSKKKQDVKSKSKKEVKLSKLLEDDDDDSDDDSDFDESREPLEELSEEEEDDDIEGYEEDTSFDKIEDEDVEEEDDDESEDDEPAPKLQKIDNNKGKAQQNGLTNGKGLSKKEEKKLKKKEKQQQNQQQKKESPQQKPVDQAKSPKEKILQGGVKIEDIRIGKGLDAKPGKRVQVYYEGRLKQTNKVFDSAKSGEGFKFSLGRGEVIRGWDIGVAGMKVGSKRRITCPPNMAYGAKGSPPVIPGNATLVFDVELRGVN